MYQFENLESCPHDGWGLLPAVQNLPHGSGDLALSAADDETKEIVGAPPAIAMAAAQSLNVSFHSPFVQPTVGNEFVSYDELIPSLFEMNDERILVETERTPVSSTNTEILIGESIRGRYKIDRVLWQDESTVSYLGHDRFSDSRRVVVKLLLADATPDAEFLKRFNEEKYALSIINHPSVINIIDSGELAENTPFVVFNYVEGESLRAVMQQVGKLTKTRAANIIRQIGQALTEAHNNRLLHRNLHPGNIILKTSDSDEEQIKVTQFGITGFEDFYKPEFLPYQSPERLAGEPLSVESDVFSLAVVAFEMLTARLPFNGTLRVELLEAQERGLIYYPTSLRFNLSPAINIVFDRALAYEREKRYHHAREFGEALFTALTEKTILTVGKTAVLSHQTPEETSETEIFDEAPATALENSQLAVATPNLLEDLNKIEPKSKIKTISVHRRARKNHFVNWYLIILSVLAAVLITSVFWWLSLRGGFGEKQNDVPISDAQIVSPNNAAALSELNANREQNLRPSVPAVKPLPENYVRFENLKKNLDGKLAERFVDFSLAYPSNWQRNRDEKKAGVFFDAANRAPSGFPREQIVVSWYESKGSFDADRAAFPRLTEKLTDIYVKHIPKFKKLSDGKTEFQGRAAYELKFTGKTENDKGEQVQIWGRTIFLPIGANNQSSGLLLTMLATSLTPTLSNADDVGERGEIARILETFSLDANSALKE